MVKVASKSSISGKAYKIKFSDASTVTANKWLLKKLKNYSTDNK